MKKLHFLFIILFVTGCTKDKFDPAPINLTFSGKVLDFSTGQPVGNANVTLALVNFESMDRYPTHHNTVADAQGNFTFYVSAKDENEFNITASKEGYVFPDTSHSWMQNMTSTTTYYVNVPLDKASFIQINFHDDRLTSANDTLNLLVGLGNDPLFNDPYWKSISHVGIMSYNTVLQFFDSVSYKQNNYATIFYKVFNNGEHLGPSTTVQLIPFGTRVVDVYY